MLSSFVNQGHMFDLLDPPIWDGSVSQVQEVSMGAEVKVKCAVCASPAPNPSQIKWKHEGVDYTQLPNVSVNHEGELVIHKMATRHLGTYTCEVINPVKLELKIQDGLSMSFDIVLKNKGKNQST